MPDFYSGTRLAPSKKAYDGLSPEVIRKLCYQTQAMRDYPGRVPCQEVVGENYSQVHYMGQRQTKYMDFQLKTSALTSRTATNNAHSYQPLPLGDNLVNKALAECFKSGWQSSKGPNNCPMDGTTSYEDTFTEKTLDEMKGAKREPMIPTRELTHTIAPPMKLMETKSHEQSFYTKPSMSMRSKPAVPPVPCHYIGGAPRDVWPRTTMKRVHDLEAVRVPRCASTPNIGLTPMAPVDEEIMMRPRCVYMEPAK